MNVRDLMCWPPDWVGARRGSSHVANSEDGILIGVRWDLKNQSVALTMEHEGERYSAVLKDEAGSLTKLYLLLGWHVGRPLAKIGSLEIAPNLHGLRDRSTREVRNPAGHRQKAN